MRRILSINIIDVVPFSKGLLFVRKEQLSNGSVKVSFFSYDITTGKIAPVTKSVYLLNKFGSAYAPIAEHLGDYVSCDTCRLPNGQTFVIYTTGEAGIFDDKGAVLWTGDILYQDAPARDAAADGRFVWCVVPKKNAIIKYSLAGKKVVMRIGGDRTTSFSLPGSVAIYDNMLYVSNRGSNKIRTIRLSDFAVEDYRLFEEPVHKYLRVQDKEFVILDSGVYIL